ncbi:37S ribosomal protein S16, mitochondrial [Fusarium falciforme]|nr:37S ribosomal protein S16, mitochondrial [Fusarium falciforme]
MTEGRKVQGTDITSALCFQRQACRARTPNPGLGPTSDWLERQNQAPGSGVRNCSPSRYQLQPFYLGRDRQFPSPIAAMVVKIRLARFGRRNQPFYNIVIAHARTARNSRPLEVIGTYDPIPKPDPYDNSGKLHKDIKLDTQRARYWIGVGAQPTDTAWRLLSMVGILPKKQFGPKQDQQKGTVKTEEVKVR